MDLLFLLATALMGAAIVGLVRGCDALGARP